MKIIYATLLIVAALNVSANEDKGKIYYTNGQKLYNQKKYTEAIKQYRKAVELIPDNAEVYYRIGMSYKHLEDYDSAVKEYRKAIELEPDYKLAHYYLAMVYLKKGNKKDAYYELDKLRYIYSFLNSIGSLTIALVIFFVLIGAIYLIKKIRSIQSLIIKTIRIPWNFKDVFKIILLPPVLFFVIGSVFGVSIVLGQTGALLLILPLGLFPIYFVLFKYRKNICVLGFKWNCIIIDIGAALIAFAVIYGLTYLTCKPTQEYINKLKILSDVKTVPSLIYLFIVAAIVVPICEEIFNRGFLYPLIKKEVGVIWGILLTSLFFSLSHYSYGNFLHIGITGIVLTSLYAVRKTLYAPILVHCLNNSLFVIIYSGYF